MDYKSFDNVELPTLQSMEKHKNSYSLEYNSKFNLYDCRDFIECSLQDIFEGINERFEYILDNEYNEEIYNELIKSLDYLAFIDYDEINLTPLIPQIIAILENIDHNDIVLSLLHLLNTKLMNIDNSNEIERFFKFMLTYSKYQNGLTLKYVNSILIRLFQLDNFASVNIIWKYVKKQHSYETISKLDMFFSQILTSDSIWNELDNKYIDIIKIFINIITISIENKTFTWALGEMILKINEKLKTKDITLNILYESNLCPRIIENYFSTENENNEILHKIIIELLLNRFFPPKFIHKIIFLLLHSLENLQNIKCCDYIPLIIIIIQRNYTAVEVTNKMIKIVLQLCIEQSSLCYDCFVKFIKIVVDMLFNYSEVLIEPSIIEMLHDLILREKYLYDFEEYLRLTYCSMKENISREFYYHDFNDIKEFLEKNIKAKYIPYK